MALSFPLPYLLFPWQTSRLLHPLRFLEESFLAEVSRWPLWIPVFLAFGILIYFSLPVEPSLPVLLGGFLCCCLGLGYKRSPGLWFILIPPTFIILGVGAAFFRTHSLHTPMLHFPLPPLILEGRIEKVELKPTKKGTFSQRLLLKRTSPDLPLSKAWVTLKGKKERLWPGQQIQLKVKLSPLSDAALPGEFDFRRHAYFQGIGATGFALSTPHIVRDDPSWLEALEKKREEITAFFLDSLTPPTGAIAAALITGDKSALPEPIREAFINSGLAHILAISGLHLTIIAGVVFALFRRGLALIPSLSLFYNIKKIAAAATILLTFMYLVLSGFGIPAERAFIMISIVMGAILIDRSALSMRTVAFAAFLILLTTPEALLGASFQLSFAAVVGLISGYETWRNPLAQWGGGSFLRKGALYAGGIGFTSLLATLATLPFTLYIFHRFSLHAIEANLLAVPLTSLVIMPAAFLSCLLTPLHLGAWPLWVLEKSIGYLVSIATTVSEWPGANIEVSHPPLLFFILWVVGGLWLCLWRRPWRRGGLVLIALGGLCFFFNNPPQILIDGRGKVAGLYRDQTLFVSSNRKGKFTTEIWRKHLAASKVEPLPCKEGVCVGRIKDLPISISYRKENQPCRKGELLIRFEPSQKACPEALRVIDWYDLWRGGAHALWVTQDGLEVEKVRSFKRDRPWEKKAIPRKKRLTPQ